MKWVLAGTAFLLLAPALLLAPIAAVPDTAIAYAGASEDKLISLVLSNPAIRFESSPRRDVESGLIDSRLLVTLFSIARTHDITINVLVSGHSYFVKDTNRVSNHIFGRGVDIPVVDGLKVSSSNAAALVLVQEVTSLPISIRPRGDWLPLAHAGGVHRCRPQRPHPSGVGSKVTIIPSDERFRPCGHRTVEVGEFVCR